MIGRFVWSTFNAVRYRIRKHLLHNTDAFDEWFHDRGDQTVSITYPLHSDSVVFEVGGYDGTWSAKIATLYDPRIYAFEPVRTFYNGLDKRFASNPKVQAFPFGLSDRNEASEICLSNDGSSLYKSSGPRELIQLRDICGVLEELQISRIDLIQINIEGGEFRLLRRMLDAGVTDICANVQIQFHNVVPDAREQRQEIRSRLAKTHSLLYDYPFVWESWRLKS
jgi:FkbM family methyltransferase